MPTIKNKKSKQTSLPRPFWLQKWFLVLSTVLLVIGIGAAALLVLRENKEKAIATEGARFETADKEVKEVTDAIIAATGQPYAVKEDKSCTQRSTKWEEAPLSCSTSKYLFYSVNDHIDANKYVEIAKSSAKLTWQYKNTDGSNNLNGLNMFKSLDVQNYSYSSSYQLVLHEYTSVLSRMKCAASNIFYMASQPPFNEYISNNEKYLVALSIHCSDTAKVAQYTIRN